MAPTVLVKGAGPTGLASAAILSQLGCNVRVIEKRERHAPGGGRRNVVAIRPEALRNLDQLGALDFLVSHGALTDMTSGATVNEWADSVFDWNPHFRRYPAEQSTDRNEEIDGYVVPGKITDQIPSTFVHLGDLEDALLHVCTASGVQVIYGSTIRLDPYFNDHKPTDKLNTKYTARVIEIDRNPSQQDDGKVEGETIIPDLIICASGKNDTDLTLDLGFRRYTGVQLDEQCIPEYHSQPQFDPSQSASSLSNSCKLQLGAEGEIERQNYSVFAVRHPQNQTSRQTQPRAESTNGVITHIVRKEGTGTPHQPLTEITMSHKDASHLILQLPRDLDISPANQTALEAYLVSRVNAKLDTEFHSVHDMHSSGSIVVGNPLVPVLVETSTAPSFVCGSNVVLVGDAAMSCSPASGIGADIGMTVDSQNVKSLGKGLFSSLEHEGKERREIWEDTLVNFNRRRAEAAIIWSQASRMFYVTGKEANRILQEIGSNRDNAVAAN